MAAGIFCIENWSKDLRSSGTVGPLLDFMSSSGDARVIHQRVSTVYELTHYLRRFSALRSYQVAYLALHGDRGKVYVGDEGVELEDLVTWTMLSGRRSGGVGSNGDSDDSVIDLRGKVLYFGSCGSLGIPRDRLRLMREETGAAAVCGYMRQVDWYAAASFEILLLATLVNAVDGNRSGDVHRSLPPAISGLRRSAGTFVDRTLGFVCEPDWRP